MKVGEHTSQGSIHLVFSLCFIGLNSVLRLCPAARDLGDILVLAATSPAKAPVAMKEERNS